MGSVCMLELNEEYAIPVPKDQSSLLVDTNNLVLRAKNGIRKLQLQTRPNTNVHMVELERMLGLPLPEGPQEKVEDIFTIYWNGPNNWLILNPTVNLDNIEVAFRKAVCGATCAVTYMTDAYSIIEVSGNEAIERISEGCSVDLDINAFTPGHYVLTRLQNLAVIIHKLNDARSIRILVDRSMARFLWDWLGESIS